MPRYQWGHLNKQQVGAFAEYFVKMELTMYGFQVYGSEVDDRGIDFVACLPGGPFLRVQVKSLRRPGYVFMRKANFEPHEHLYLALALLFREGEPPALYLVPSTAWHACDGVFVGRDYDGRTSPPEWGINVSTRNLRALGVHAFDAAVARLLLAGAIPADVAP